MHVHPPQLLEASRRELAQVEALLGGDAAALRKENSRLAARLQAARGLLAEHSPCGAASPYADGGSALRRSPLPFSLFGRLGDRPGIGSSEGEASPAASAAACPSPDVFSSPFLASQATLTVDYRDLAPPSTGAASVRQVRECCQGAARLWPAAAGGPGVAGVACSRGSA